VAITNKDLEKIRKKLQHFSLEQTPDTFLDTGNQDLNEVLGNRELGLSYGRLIEISGWESTAKSALSLMLAALAQAQGANVVWLDLETSKDEAWWRKRSLDPDKVACIQPYVGHFGAEKEKRLASAEELCEEAEDMIAADYKPGRKTILVLDSIPALLTEAEASAGIVDQNMKSGTMSTPVFLSRLLRRWAGISISYNVLSIFINQLRQSPQPFKPDYTPGGNGPRFYCHSRVRMRRVGKGLMLDKHKNVVGIEGIITNFKNKSGSPERARIGFRLPHGEPFEFVPVDVIEKRGSDE
jgi:recombination protein RecA